MYTHIYINRKVHKYIHRVCVCACIHACIPCLSCSTGQSGDNAACMLKIVTTTHQHGLFSIITNKTEWISFSSELLSQEDLLLFKHPQRPSDSQHLLMDFACRRLHWRMRNQWFMCTQIPQRPSTEPS